MINRFDGDHRFLSNFWPCDLYFEGVTYPSVEHLYQCAKTQNDQDWLYIWQARSAGEAKRRGRQVAIAPSFDQERIEVMRTALRLKFYEGGELARLLLATYPQEIVEGNTWHDRFWGRCYCPKHYGQGQNWLGRLLMERRQELRCT